jgi:hypothetical protein
MVSEDYPGVTFAQTITLIPPSAGAQRDDDRMSTGDLPPPAAMLYAMNLPSCPDRDHLIRYPQGLWSGKSAASDADFRHINGFGGTITQAAGQDEEAIRQLGTKFQAMSAHIPNIKEAERVLEGDLVESPYTSHGRNDAGRESARIHDLRMAHSELTRAGVPRHSLLHMESRVNALALRKERENQHKQVIADFSKSRMTHHIPNRFAWQNSIVPGHPLYHRDKSIKSFGRRYTSRGRDYLNLNPPETEAVFDESSNAELGRSLKVAIPHASHLVY